MQRRVRRSASLVVSSLVFTVIFGIAGHATAALHRPTYAAGDRWVYILSGSVDTFPGFNASQGTLHFVVTGQADLKVIGPADIAQGNTTVRTVRVDSHTSGFLNGTFNVPGTGSADVTGTFTTDTSEFWEDQAYLTIASHGTTSYVAKVTFFLPTDLLLNVRLDATTSVPSVPSFDLDVGQSATANLATHVELNSTVTFVGRTRSQTNATDVSSTWRREVLSVENVTVEAGTFSSYRLNQTAGNFPGIPFLLAGGNETAYFSNDVGYYTKRDAYQNGTRVGEMRLKSYSYGSTSPSFLSTWFPLILVAVIAAAILLVLLLWRRRKARPQPRTSPPAPPDDQTRGGGNDRAR
jgi:hypothetical protein